MLHVFFSVMHLKLHWLQWSKCQVCSTTHMDCVICIGFCTCSYLLRKHLVTWNERTTCAQLRRIPHAHLRSLMNASRIFFIFARNHKPCPVRGMTLLEHFAEVLTIDLAQLASARKVGSAVSYYVPPNATHLRPYREPL